MELKDDALLLFFFLVCLCVDDSWWLSCPQAEIWESFLIAILPQFHLEKLAELLSTGQSSGLKLNSNRSLKGKVSKQFQMCLINLKLQKPLPPHKQNKQPVWTCTVSSFAFQTAAQTLCACFGESSGSDKWLRSICIHVITALLIITSSVSSYLNLWIQK